MKKVWLIALIAISTGVLAAVVLELQNKDRLRGAGQPVKESLRPLSPRFTNTAPSLGLQAFPKGPKCSANAAAAAWMDQGRGKKPLLLFSAYETGVRFWDVSTDKAKLVKELKVGGGVAGISPIDFDNDGDEDLLVTTQKGSRLFKAQAGALVDITKDSGLPQSGLQMDAAWGDMDRDGLLDLAISRGNNCNGGNLGALRFSTLQVYRQLRPGKFVEATSEMKPRPRRSLGLAVAWTDLNDDGWLDLYLGNDYIGGGKNQAWLNRRGSLVKGFPSTEIGINSMGLGLGDVDNDERMDIAISNIQPINLLLNRPGNFLRERLSSYSYAWIPVTWGLIVEDFNNDGLEDIWSASGGIEGSGPDRQVLFLNTGPDEDLVDVARFSGLTGLFRGRSPASVDLNGDGLLDVALASLNGPPGLFINRGAQSQGSWIQIKLEGSPGQGSPLAACGSRVWVESEGKRWMREVECSSEGYLGASDRTLHVGLGGIQGRVNTRVRWPNGKESRYSLLVNRKHNIGESGDSASLSRTSGKLTP